MSTVQTLVILQNNKIMRGFNLFPHVQAQYMFVFDVIMELIENEDHCITGPVDVAKEKLKKLAMVNSTTKISGYESQFKVSKLYYDISFGHIIMYVTVMLNQNLENVSPKVVDFQYDSACSDENWHKNRSVKHLPRKLPSASHNNSCHAVITADSSRVCITSSETQSDYICANYINVRMNY